MVQRADNNGYWIILISTFIPKLVAAVTTVLLSQQYLEKDCTHLIIPDPPVAPCHHYNIKKRSTGTINTKEQKVGGKIKCSHSLPKGSRVSLPVQFQFHLQIFHYSSFP